MYMYGTSAYTPTVMNSYYTRTRCSDRACSARGDGAAARGGGVRARRVLAAGGALGVGRLSCAAHARTRAHSLCASGRRGRGRERERECLLHCRRRHWVYNTQILYWTQIWYSYLGLKYYGVADSQFLVY